MKGNRIESIDLLRGLVMVIMALDHTRDFFHRPAFLDDPLNLATTSPYLFFTRWITHYCAPVFVFLAGTSAFLQGLRKSKKELSSFLIKRGLWLILIEVLVITFAITFNIAFNTIILQVIWAIGLSMLLLGFVIWLHFRIILGLGILIVFGHNLLDFVEAHHQGEFGFWWDLLRRGNFARYPLFDNHYIVIIYPFVPWTGLMLLGYCFGKLFQPSVDPGYRKKVLIWSGLAIILFFIGLRASNIYGDPVMWSVQKNGFFSFLSFINTHKYPPSLLFTCMTIGPALLFLAWTENISNRLTGIITVYGRVPFLYYVLHFYLLHTICSLAFLLRGHSFAEGLEGVTGVPFKFLIPGEGFGLVGVYIVWISVVIALYPVCRWFSNYKNREKKWWLSYL